MSVRFFNCMKGGCQFTPAFTLIELLVTLGIVVVLSAATIPNFRVFGAQAQLKGAAEELKSLVLEAQALALAPRSEDRAVRAYQVAVQPNQAELFLVTQSGQNSIRILSLPQGVTASPPASVRFNFGAKGKPEAPAQQVFTLTTSKPSPAKTIQVTLDPSGRVDLSK